MLHVEGDCQIDLFFFLFQNKNQTPATAGNGITSTPGTSGNESLDTPDYDTDPNCITPAEGIWRSITQGTDHTIQNYVLLENDSAGNLLTQEIKYDDLEDKISLEIDGEQFVGKLSKIDKSGNT